MTEEERVKDLITRIQQNTMAASRALGSAQGPDHKLAILANYGDLALSHSALAADALAGQAARIAELERMGAPGQLTGMKDKHGTEIRIGDTLEFDFNEWNRDEMNRLRWSGKEINPDDLEECVFEMEYRDGELFHPGGRSDLSTYCEIIEKVKT